MIGCNRRLQEIETYLKPSELDEGRAPVANPRRIEQAVHAYLAPKRVNKRREFFAVTVEQAINTIRSLSEEVRRRNELAAAEARYRNTLTAAKAALAAKENWRRGVLTNRKEMEALAALLALRDGLKIEDLQLPRDKPVLPGVRNLDPVPVALVLGFACWNVEHPTRNYCRGRELDEGRLPLNGERRCVAVTTIMLALMFMTVGAQAELITNGNFSGGNTSVCSGENGAAVCPGWTVTLGNGPNLDFNATDETKGIIIPANTGWVTYGGVLTTDDVISQVTNRRRADVSSQLSTRHQQPRPRDRRPSPWAGLQCDPWRRQYLS